MSRRVSVSYITVVGDAENPGMEPGKNDRNCLVYTSFPEPDLPYLLKNPLDINAIANARWMPHWFFEPQIPSHSFTNVQVTHFVLLPGSKPKRKYL